MVQYKIYLFRGFFLKETFHCKAYMHGEKYINHN